MRKWELVTYLLSKSTPMAWYLENSRKFWISISYCYFPTSVPIRLYVMLTQLQGMLSEHEKTLLLWYFCSMQHSGRNKENCMLLDHIGPSFHLLCPLPPLFFPLFPSLPLYYSTSKSPHSLPTINSLIVSVQLSQEKHFITMLASIDLLKCSLVSPPPSEETTCMDNALVWLCFSNAYKL